MTSTDQHYGVPSNDAELLGATHAWRTMLRQAAAHLSIMAEQPGERATRGALDDVATHLNQACALLTNIDATLDPSIGAARRAHCQAELSDRARGHEVHRAS